MWIGVELNSGNADEGLEGQGGCVQLGTSRASNHNGLMVLGWTWPGAGCIPSIPINDEAELEVRCQVHLSIGQQTCALTELEAVGGGEVKDCLASPLGMPRAIFSSYLHCGVLMSTSPIPYFPLNNLSSPFAPVPSLSLPSSSVPPSPLCSPLLSFSALI